jgi:hypothetical protein
MHSKTSRLPALKIKLIPPVWPMQRWGIDVVGPLPPAPGDLRYAVVAVDYFTKWTESIAVPKISSHYMRKFVWRNIVCRFGVPQEIVCDNATSFDSEEFKGFCNSLRTKIHFASVYYPQSNGAVERVNAEIFDAVRKRLEGCPKGKWVEELPHVLCSIRTKTWRPTGFTPFRLMYGEEAVTPEEIKLKSLRTQTQNKDIETAKETLEEIRLQAVTNLEKYQEETKRWRDKNISVKDIKPGDFVLQKVMDHVKKLHPKWNGPFLVTEMPRPGAYRLQTMDGSDVDHTWNIQNLKKYHM